jgi:CRISPR-associated protein Csb2
MQIVLRQTFPLGRFHATPWRINPFDDPHGEWPPSPWRLVRAIVARWYQWSREESSELPVPQEEELLRALCMSIYSFHLPIHARKGNPIRQYLPADFAWNPKQKKKAALRGYGTSLAQDNFWSVPCDEKGAVWWFIESDKWTDALIKPLDHCLERITYFGRAETFSTIRRLSESPLPPNCILSEHRVPGSVPILVPTPDAKRADVERVTEDPESIRRTVPPGARMLYAIIPKRPPAREIPTVSHVNTETHIYQFAIGWNVPPEPRAIVRLTARFRSVVLRELIRIKSGDPTATWRTINASVREVIADMLGKDFQDKTLIGHKHAEFLAWFEEGIPTRLLVWRNGRAFDDDEQGAILRGASREISWAEAGPDSDAWKVKLVPLDSAVPPPPGFDGNPYTSWESVTPYVPPRHHLRGGKPREKESVSSQIQRELKLRGFVDAVSVEELCESTWVAVHIPRKRGSKRVFLGDRRGYRIRLIFSKPIVGPLRLGHSSSFGLGLFRPIKSGMDGNE